MSLILSTVLAAALTPSFQDPEPASSHWVTDWDGAKAAAKKDEKDLLVDFTGSDWCIWCQRLKAEVFDLDAFKDAAPKSFVLVELDYPNDTSNQTEALQAQNAKLREQYGIDSYPTILLMDHAGLPYASTGYREGGPEGYVAHLVELQEKRQQRDGYVKQADAAKGVDRAKALASALEVVDESLHRHYGAWIDEVIALDADGAAGLKEAFTKKKQAIAMAAMVADVQRKVNEFAEREDWAGAAKLLDDFLVAQKDVADGNTKHELLFYRALIAAQTNDFALAIEKLEAAKKLVPDHEMNPRIDQMIEQLKKMAAGGGR